MTVHNKKLTSGFTLIELLIVIAILGVLAVVVLVAINPVQQLARTRDAGRESGVTQLGHAIEAYAVTHNGSYPASAGTWGTDLVSAGEITIVPAGISMTAGEDVVCEVNMIGDPTTWCYNTSSAGSIIYAALESDSKGSLCDAPTTESPFFVYSTAAGRGGVVCATTLGTIQPAVGITTFQN